MQKYIIKYRDKDSVTEPEYEYSLIYGCGSLPAAYEYIIKFKDLNPTVNVVIESVEELVL